MQQRPKNQQKSLTRCRFQLASYAGRYPSQPAALPREKGHLTQLSLRRPPRSKWPNQGAESSALGQAISTLLKLISMPSTPATPTLEEVSRLIFTRTQAARVADLHVSAIDRLKALGRLPAITDENGRAIAYLRSDILALVGGSYRLKPRQPAYRTQARKGGNMSAPAEIEYRPAADWP